MKNIILALTLYTISMTSAYADVFIGRVNQVFTNNDTGGGFVILSNGSTGTDLTVLSFNTLETLNMLTANRITNVSQSNFISLLTITHANGAIQLING